ILYFAAWLPRFAAVPPYRAAVAYIETSEELRRVVGGDPVVGRFPPGREEVGRRLRAIRPPGPGAERVGDGAARPRPGRPRLARRRRGLPGRGRRRRGLDGGPSRRGPAGGGCPEARRGTRPFGARLRALPARPPSGGAGGVRPGRRTGPGEQGDAEPARLGAPRPRRFPPRRGRC